MSQSLDGVTDLVISLNFGLQLRQQLLNDARPTISMKMVLDLVSADNIAVR